MTRSDIKSIEDEKPEQIIIEKPKKKKKEPKEGEEEGNEEGDQEKEGGEGGEGGEEEKQDEEEPQEEENPDGPKQPFPLSCHTYLRTPDHDAAGYERECSNLPSPSSAPYRAS